MFDNTEHVGMRLQDIAHRIMDKDEKEIGLVVLTFEINPLTPELATDLDEFMRSMLFTRTDAAVNAKLQGAKFDLSIQPQEMVVRMAKDQKKDSFTITEAKIGTFHARRSKKSTGWRLVFDITCSPASEHQLAQIADSIGKHRYITFADARPDLFSELGEEERKTRKAARSAGAAASATATH